MSRVPNGKKWRKTILVDSISLYGSIILNGSRLLIFNHSRLKPPVRTGRDCNDVRGGVVICRLRKRIVSYSPSKVFGDEIKVWPSDAIWCPRFWRVFGQSLIASPGLPRTLKREQFDWRVLHVSLLSFSIKDYQKALDSLNIKWSWSHNKWYTWHY